MTHPLTSRLAAIATAIVLLSSSAAVRADQDGLPASIPDAEFWSLTERLSEPNGTFRSDNLLSNEMTLSYVATLLTERVKPNGVYLGVGPEQNFTYIAAMRPRIAFITDIRRGFVNKRDTNSARSADRSNSALYINCRYRLRRWMSVMNAMPGRVAAM